MELPGALARRAVLDLQASQLVGQVVTSPVREGDLLLASAIVDDARVPATEKLSFSLPVADAVGGTLQPGERIDVLATYGSGADAWTSFVARGVLLVDSSLPATSMGTADEVTLTVAVSSLRDVQALGHAIRAAEVFVTRSTVTQGATDRAPDAYVPSREEPGPAPDGGPDPVGAGTAGTDRGEAAGTDDHDEGQDG
jgi:hypothetical protein